jgi:hypothetical protein
MEQWSLIPNMVSLKQDITIQTQDCSLQVQDYKVMTIIEKICFKHLSVIARPASQGIPRPGQSRLQAPGQFQRLVLFLFSYFICTLGNNKHIYNL